MSLLPAGRFRLVRIFIQHDSPLDVLGITPEGTIRQTASDDTGHRGVRCRRWQFGMEFLVLFITNTECIGILLANISCFVSKITERSLEHL